MYYELKVLECTLNIVQSVAKVIMHFGLQKNNAHQFVRASGLFWPTWRSAPAHPLMWVSATERKQETKNLCTYFTVSKQYKHCNNLNRYNKRISISNVN